jgi:hypothetical protein
MSDMALLDWEGFDRETANLGIFSTFMGEISSDNSGVFGYGRYLYRTLPSQASSAGRYNCFPNIATVFIQCHIFFNNAFQNYVQVWLTDGSTNQIGFRIRNDGKPQIVRGDDTVLANAANSVALNTWHFFQFRATVADSNGTAELRVNGQTIVTYTGDTKNTTNAYVNGWRVEASSAGQNGWFDNIIVYSNTGNPPNTWTPETRIFDVLPTGAGDTTEWTPSAGANWQCVNEQPSNGDTSYVSAASSPLTDVYAFSTPVPAGAIVYGVAVHATARKDDAGTNNVDGVIQSGGTNYAKGSPQALTSTYVRYRWLWDVDPATSAPWTVAAANAAQAGVRRTS